MFGFYRRSRSIVLPHPPDMGGGDEVTWPRALHLIGSELGVQVSDMPETRRFALYPQSGVETTLDHVQTVAEHYYRAGLWQVGPSRNCDTINTWAAFYVRAISARHLQMLTVRCIDRPDRHQYNLTRSAEGWIGWDLHERANLHRWPVTKPLSDGCQILIN